MGRHTPDLGLQPGRILRRISALAPVGDPWVRGKGVITQPKGGCNCGGPRRRCEHTVAYRWRRTASAMGLCSSKPSVKEEESAQMFQEGVDPSRINTFLDRDEEEARRGTEEEDPPIGTFGLDPYLTNIRLIGKGREAETYLMRISDDPAVLEEQPVLRAFAGLEVAVKILPCGYDLSESRLFREISIQSALHHVNIVQLYFVVLTQKYLAIVLEYAAGGRLNDYIKLYSPDTDHKIGHTNYGRGNNEGVDVFLSEDQARYFFKQFISAVSFCHRHQVAHRDLKLENTLIDSRIPPRIKICDFGMSKGWEDNEERNAYTVLGTVDYVAPEILEEDMVKLEGYNPEEADVWSSGVLLYTMLCGREPFESKSGLGTELKTITKNMARMARYQGAAYMYEEILGLDRADFTKECKALLMGMLQLDPSKRMTIDDILNSPWFLKSLPPKEASALFQIEEEERELQQKAYYDKEAGEVLEPDKDITQTVPASSLEQLRKILNVAGGFAPDAPFENDSVFWANPLALEVAASR